MYCLLSKCKKLGCGEPKMFLIKIKHCRKLELLQVFVRIHTISVQSSNHTVNKDFPTEY